MILDVTMTANDFIHYLRGYLEDKNSLNASELTAIKEKLKEVYTYSAPSYPPYHPYSPFIITTDKPDISRGPTCTGDPIRNDMK